MKLERYRDKPPASISGTCRIENWDCQLEEIKDVLGADALVKIHGQMEDLYVFTALATRPVKK